MTFLVVCFASGIALAAWRPPSPAGRRLASRLTLVGLAVILALMGARIGATPEVLSQVGTLGMKALVLAIGAIAGSVALVWAARPLLRSTHDSHRLARPPRDQEAASPCPAPDADGAREAP